MIELKKMTLGQVTPGQWTLMQEVFVVPPKAYAASFKLFVGDQAQGEAFTVKEAFAGIVPDSWKKGNAIPAEIVNLIPNPNFRRGYFAPAGWRLNVGGYPERAGYTTVPADTPPEPQLDGIRIEGSDILLYVDSLPVRPGQRLLYSLQVKSTNSRPRILVVWPEWQKSNPTDLNTIRIRNPKKLTVDHLPAERIPVGDIGHYKPAVVKLGGDELLLTCYLGNVKGLPALLYRSKDGGRSWSDPDKPTFALGGEPYPTRVSDGTLLFTGGGWGYRSEDAGRSFAKYVCPEFDGRRAAGNHPRNILQLNDGSLLQIVDVPSREGQRFQRGNDYIARSTDSGATWPQVYPAQVEGLPGDHSYTIFLESHLCQARSGKLYAIARVDPRVFPLPNRQLTPKELGNVACSLFHSDLGPVGDTTDIYNCDHFTNLKLFSSMDMGRTWQPGRDLGDYGYMYPSVLRLADGRVLLTFTVRSIDPPLGVRAVLGTENEDGFEFDFQNDMIMIDTQTPIGRPSGGGFGPTIQLDDGTLVTSYSYWPEDDKRHPGDWQLPNPSRCAVVRWRLPVY